MLIWLGKQWLGQRDMPDRTNDTSAVEAWLEAMRAGR
jgi:hypothetical protein